MRLLRDKGQVSDFKRRSISQQATTLLSLVAIGLLQLDHVLRGLFEFLSRSPSQ